MTQLPLSLDSETWVQDSIDLLRGHLQFSQGFEFSADWLHDVLDAPPHHNAFGALFRAMKAQKLIEFVGYHQSTRKKRNGSVNGVWRVR